MDISADLEELARTPVMVVCAGAKSILDLGLTAGVPEEALLAKLQGYFEERREIAVDVKVKAPTLRTVNVTVRVKAKEGAGTAGVKARVEEALRDHTPSRASPSPASSPAV